MRRSGFRAPINGLTAATTEELISGNGSIVAVHDDAWCMFPTTGTIGLMDMTTSGIGAISGVIGTNGCDTYE
jgi:hypothetical protein